MRSYLLETVADLTGGLFADLVIDCSSGGEETVLSAINLAREGWFGAALRP
jgi:threonine dehydrogenase-like Zn-dependent dehydrogenase